MLPLRFLTFLLAVSALSAVAGELKVDINRDTKNLDSVTATGYTKWSVDTTGGATTGTAAATKSFTTATGETVTISFAMTATSGSGTGLLTNWYQSGAQGTARLVSDGFTVAPSNLSNGGQIEMKITGLATGTHTLLTYHNHWDALTSGTLGPIDVFVNGSLAVDNLQPSIRAATDTVAPIAYLTFGVSGSSTVTTILFAAETTTPASVGIKNPVLNGFEIDTPNSTRIANSPSPLDADEHVNADAGSTTLSWAPATAGTAVTHDVYFGTSLAAVRDATHASPEFKGNQSSLSYPATGLNSALTYYWRVDEIDSQGNATRGTVWYFRPRHLAFPGAEGYGRFARGGRGGVVIEVTNLNDSGPGSLRDALTGNYGPRTVVFTVSGLVTLASDLTISQNQPYLTLAGQTAPGKGICVRGFPLGVSGGKDVIIRNMRMRPGKLAGTSATYNASGLAGSDHCIMDRCSISWGVDEEISTRTSKNVTLQRTLISEALNVAGHQNYSPGTAHGYAASIGGDVGSFHHNLLAHNEGRNWSLAGGLDAAGYFAGRMDIFNNVVYNWDSRTTDGGAHEVNFVNNYYKKGPSSTFNYALSAQYDNFPGTQQYYFAGNVMPGVFNEANQTSGRRAVNGSGSVPTTYSPWVSTPFFPSYATMQTAGDAYRIVLSDVGCNQPLIDDHDVRVLWETLSGTYTYKGSVSGKKGLPDNQADVGGWENYPALTRPATWDSDHDGLPDWWEEMIGTNANSALGDVSDGNSDSDGDGYTALEDYLNWLADPHAAAGTIAPANVDLTRYAAGFTNATFAVSSPAHGTVSLLPDGRTAQFTPAANYHGPAGFNFTISGSGTSITRSAGVIVPPSLNAFVKTWKGGAGGNAWDFSTVNWRDSSTPEFFQNGNPAVFDDSGVPNTSVTLSGLLLPSTVTVSGTANYVFSGSGVLSGAMGLVKSGNGTLTITGTHSFSGDTTVQGGAMVLNGALNGSKLIVQSGAMLSGSGSLAGLVINSGGTVSLNSTPLTVQGSATNNGLLRATGNTRLLVSGTFLNNGVLDVLAAPGALPANLVNGPNGVVIDSTGLQVMDAAKNNQTFTITIRTYAGHGYQLQKSGTLLNPAWQNVTGQFRNGNGSDWTFTDSNATGGQVFYRLLVTTP